jgi:hypothetical protein
MNSRLVRVALLLAALGALGAGGFVIVDAEQALRQRRVGAATFDTEADAAITDLARLRTAQQAYVAEGQGSAYWLGQSAEILSKVDQDLAALAADATADATRSTIQAASAELEKFRSLDQRARQYLKSDQVLMASDVIFTDSLTALGAAADHVGAASTNERGGAEATMDALRWRQFYAASGAAGVLVLAILLLAPVPEREVDVLTAMRALTDGPVAAARRGETPAPPRSGAGDIDDVPDLEAVRAIAPNVLQPPPRVEPVDAPAPVVTPVATLPVERPVLSEVELASAARLCSDMARVLDAGDLPGLLARTASVLRAPGLIVWVADRSGHALYPLLTHGYEGATLVRMGPVSTEADNATAVAWRTGELQVVAGTPGTPGALASPIVTAEGCVGVLAAEVEDHRETREDVRALVTIFSAQLATFVTAVPAAGGSALAAEA